MRYDGPNFLCYVQTMVQLMCRLKAGAPAVLLTGVAALTLHACGSMDGESGVPAAGNSFEHRDTRVGGIGAPTSVVGGAGTGAGARTSVVGGAGTGAPADMGVAGSSPADGRGGSAAVTAGGSGMALGSGGKSAAGGGSGMMAAAGAAGRGASGGSGAAGSGSSEGVGESGRLVGMTAAHNAVRARIMSPVPNPALPPLKWSTAVAEIAQAYANELATDCSFEHSNGAGLGENLAYYEGTMQNAKNVVEGWAAEEDCYTYGPISQTEGCDMTCARAASSNGCGHYTQVVWRDTSEVGCGVAKCAGSGNHREIWVCNYRRPGNVLGMKPY